MNIFVDWTIWKYHDNKEAAIFASARITDALLHLQGQQIRVIAVYGFHSGLPDHMSQNDRLLSHVFARASDFHVPTIIAGDFNCELSALPAWSKARAVGYVDLACRQASVLNTDPDMTFKGVSRLDYVVANPFAARAFRSMQVDPKGFTDHAVITAFFEWDSLHHNPPIWNMPFDIGKCQAITEPFKHTPPLQDHVQWFQEALQYGALDHAAGIFSKAFERKAQQVHAKVVHQPLRQAFLGRLQGKFIRREPQRVIVSQATQLVSDRVQIQQRLKTLDKIRELHRLLQRNPESARRQQLWLQILKSKGFVPDFPSWLMDNDLVPLVPLTVPDTEWLHELVKQMAEHAKHWDVVRQRQKQQSISAMFSQDWAKGGKLHAQILKDPSPATLDGLLQKTELSVRLRRACKTSAAVVTVDRPHLVKVGASWHFGKCQAIVVSLQGTAVKLDRPATVQMTRKTVVQSAWSTETGFVATEVQSYWDSFWNAKQNLNLEVTALLLQTMPQIPVFDATVTAQDVALAIKGLNPHKARGMDGWSNTELKMLHPHEVDMLAHFFNCILQHQRWPTSLSTAWVALLAKIPQPLQPKDGRPITILPTLYRLWAKIMSRKVFQAMLPFIPKDLYGSVPGKSTMDAAWELQSTLEECLCDDTTLLGVTLDLSKAYNTLPRPFLQQLAAKAGWPPCLINTYMSFLHSLKRFFRIHDGLHAGTMSTVGVPEGCPLAVPMMILVTMSVTNFVNLQNGRLISYVDNWTMLASDSDKLEVLLNKVKWATDGLALLLNPEKTAAFATHSQARALLRKKLFAGFPLTVVHSTHDLGVTFTSTKKVTSAALGARMEANQGKLDRLQMLPWKSHRKCQMLQRVIMPAMFYGSPLASTPPTLLATLRRKFSVAVWGKCNHRNHFLAPLFSTAEVYEPFHAIFRLRIQALRRAFIQQPDSTLRRWEKAISSRGSGPMRYLFDFLALLQWSLQPNFVVQTQRTQFSLVQANLEDILRCMHQDWLSYVADKLSDKEQWSGLHWVDWQFSRRLRSKASLDPAAMGNFTTGAAIFSDQKKHFLEEGVVCAHCGEEDSQEHRFFHCPHYNECRQSLPMQEMMTWPQLQVQKGLFRKPYALQHWEEIVHDLPAPSFTQEFDEHVFLFTDGSTFAADTVPVSAWAVVLADPEKMDATVVEKGWLSGPQNNYRAELYAVLVAIQHSALATLFVDNEAVVLGLKRLQVCGWESGFWLGHQHRDLWLQIWEQWQSKDPSQWTIIHVRSHQEINNVATWQEAWQIYHNNFVDSVAVAVNKQRPPEQLRSLRLARMEFQRVAKQAASCFQLQQNILQCAKLSGNPAATGSTMDRVWGLHFNVPSYIVQENEAMMCPPLFVSAFQVYDWDMGTLSTTDELT